VPFFCAYASKTLPNFVLRLICAGVGGVDGGVRKGERADQRVSEGVPPRWREKG
jgi:hypothetical protein